MKEEALDRTMWRNRFGRGFGPVVLQITDDDDDDEYLCFGHICSPSSGGILYVYSNWYVSCFLVDWKYFSSKVVS